MRVEDIDDPLREAKIRAMTIRGLCRLISVRFVD